PRPTRPRLHHPRRRHHHPARRRTPTRPHHRRTHPARPSPPPRPHHHTSLTLPRGSTVAPWATSSSSSTSISTGPVRVLVGMTRHAERSTCRACAPSAPRSAPHERFSAFVSSGSF